MGGIHTLLLSFVEFFNAHNNPGNAKRKVACIPIYSQLTTFLCLEVVTQFTNIHFIHCHSNWKGQKWYTFTKWLQGSTSTLSTGKSGLILLV